MLVALIQQLGLVESGFIVVVLALFLHLLQLIFNPLQRHILLSNQALHYHHLFLSVFPA